MYSLIQWFFILHMALTLICANLLTSEICLFVYIYILIIAILFCGSHFLVVQLNKPNESETESVCSQNILPGVWFWQL